VKLAFMRVSCQSEFISRKCILVDSVNAMFFFLKCGLDVENKKDIRGQLFFFFLQILIAFLSRERT
jgi:hypothetical protein